MARIKRKQSTKRERALDSRRHTRVGLRIDDRGAVMTWMLRELLVMRESDRRRREAAAAIRRDLHADRDYRDGYGGLGAPWSQIDRLVGRDGGPLQAEQLDELIERAMIDSVRRNYARGPRTASRLTEIMTVAMTLAARMHEAARDGLGRVPAGSMDAAWHSMARTVLTDDELGHVIAAADLLGPGQHDSTAVGAMLAAAARPSADDRERNDVDPASEVTRRHADVADARWQRMRRSGWGEVAQRSRKRR